MIDGNADTVTTTIAANDPPSGMWDIMLTSSATVNEGDDASYTVQYTGNPSEQGASVPILVSVEFTGENPAQANDFDVDPATDGIQPLNSAALVSAISAETPTAGSSGISAMVALTLDANGNANFSFDLTIADDTTPEAEEIFTVTLSIPSGQITTLVNNADTATTTIAENDPPSGTWAITPQTATVNEGERVTYTVQYNGNPNEQGATVPILVTVEFTGENPAADNDFDVDPETPQIETLTPESLATLIGDRAMAGPSGISAIVQLATDANGDATLSVVLPILVDAITEAEETFSVTLSIPSGQITTLVPNFDTATTTIAANAVLSGIWAITSETPTVNEGERVTYTVQYTGNPSEQETAASILVTVELTNGQAQAEDFEPTLTSTTLRDAIMTSGETPTPGDDISATVRLTIDNNGSANFRVVLPIAEDGTAEEAQTFMVTLSEQTPGTTIPTPTVMTTIAANNMTPNGTWAISQANLNEQGDTVFVTDTVTVNEGETANYSIQYTGNTPAEQGSTVEITLLINLTTPVQTNDFNPRLSPTTLRDAITGIGIQRARSRGETRVEVIFTIGTDGNASFNLALPIADDGIQEAEETFTVTLSQPTTGTTINTPTATTNIAASVRTFDGIWAITPETSLVNEGDEARYTVQYDGSADEQGATVSILVTVGFTSGQAQAEDFEPTLNSAELASAISGGTPTAGAAISAMVELTIAANGSATATITLPIFDDETQEGTEIFTVTLSQPTTGTTITTNTATTNIAASDRELAGMWAIIPQNATINDDGISVTHTVNEGEGARYNVQYLGRDDEQETTVSILATVNLGTAQAEDFNPTLTSAALASTISGGTATAGDTGISAMVTLATNANGDAQFTIVLPIQEDTITEGQETFTVTLSGQTTGTTIPLPTATTTIAASDTTGTWDISQNPVDGSANEGETVTYTVQYNGTAATQGLTASILVTVDLGTAQANDFTTPLTSNTLRDAISGGTPTAGTEISAVVGITTDVNGDASFSFDLMIVNDATQEEDETFRVTLSQPSPGSRVITDTATTTIVEPIWRISGRSRRFAEEDETTRISIFYDHNPGSRRIIDQAILPETVSILVRLNIEDGDDIDGNPDTSELEPITAALLADIIRNNNGVMSATSVSDTSNENGTTTVSARVSLSRSNLDTRGEDLITLPLMIANDPDPEEEERFTVSITDPTPSVTIPDFLGYAAVIIPENDNVSGTWTITPETSTVNESETASYNVQYSPGLDLEDGIRVSILVTVGFTGENPAAAEDIDGDTSTAGRQSLTSVSLATLIGAGATAGNTGISARVAIIISGTTSFSFDLPIFDDTEFEPDETFTVTLSEPTRGTLTIDTNTATTTIAASDMTWAIDTPTPTVNEGETASYTVEYSGQGGDTSSILVTVDLR